MDPRILAKAIAPVKISQCYCNSKTTSPPETCGLFLYVAQNNPSNGMARLKTVKPRLTSPPPRLTPPPVIDRGTSGVTARRSKDWLNTARWQRLRLKILKRDGYVCQATRRALTGKHPAPNSPVVDHIIPHRGDPDLFWDEGNLQSVSKEYHDRIKQSIEKSGQV